jgi:hypothetical protein
MVMRPTLPEGLHPGNGRQPVRRSISRRKRRSGQSNATMRIVIAETGSLPPRRRAGETAQSDPPELLPPPLHPLLPLPEPLPEQPSPLLDDESPEHAECSPPEESPPHESPLLDDESPPQAESPSPDESPPHPEPLSPDDESPPHAVSPSDDDDESPPHESAEESSGVELVESPQQDASTYTSVLVPSSYDGSSGPGW